MFEVIRDHRFWIFFNLDTLHLHVDCHFKIVIANCKQRFGNFAACNSYCNKFLNFSLSISNFALVNLVSLLEGSWVEIQRNFSFEISTKFFDTFFRWWLLFAHWERNGCWSFLLLVNFCTKKPILQSLNLSIITYFTHFEFETWYKIRQNLINFYIRTKH